MKFEDLTHFQQQLFSNFVVWAKDGKFNTTKTFELITTLVENERYKGIEYYYKSFGFINQDDVSVRLPLQILFNQMKRELNVFS